ncbi:MAG: thiamine phosphate synthase [Elusimicrobia bacterium]|nr:thiamine phosphate synthase [Elusimicrobiota bacterium]
MEKLLKECFAQADLYCITAQEFSNGRGNIETVKMLLDSGIKIIQYRQKEATASQKLKECEAIRKLTQSYKACFIVNDNADIALLVDADGVHVGQDDLPISAVRRIIGTDKIVGVSTHAPKQALKAVSDGADYIGVGPVYKTFTKKDVCSAVGLEYVQWAAQNIKIPFVAIGGIKEHNIVQVKTAGAKCFALVTEIVGAQNIELKIKNLRKLI